MRPKDTGRFSAGFTLVELVIVIVVLGIISAYAMMRGVSPAEVTLPSQAEKMASDIRHAQTLAYTTGKRTLLTIVGGPNGTYSVTCVVTPPCSTDFSVTVQKGVVLGGAPTTIDFDTMGQPSAAASFTLTSGSTKTISVEPLTGNVTVSP